MRRRSDRQRLQSGHAMYSLPAGQWEAGTLNSTSMCGLPSWTCILTWTAQQDVWCATQEHMQVWGTACDECVPGQIDHDSNAAARINALPVPSGCQLIEIRHTMR